MASDVPEIAIRNLAKSFGGQQALAGVDVAVAEPEVLGIAGPNGSGKTTLLRCLLGLIAPTDGSVRVGGTPVARLGPTERARIGYMPQRRAIYEDLTVRANVAFFARLYGVEDVGAAVDEVLETVGLSDRAADRIGALSGGMVRRTSLACSFVHDPSLLVLDEPTVGLDPRLRATMWEVLRARRSAGRIVIVSTHYLDEVRRCDRVLFLREGRVLAIGTPDELRARTGAADMEDAFLALLAAADREAEAP